MSDLRAQCRNCGATGLHRHHAIPKSLCEVGRHEELNALLLCPACHAGWHDGSVTIYRDVFTRDELHWIARHASEGWLNHWYPVRPVEWGVF